MADDGAVTEQEGLRAALGDDARIAADLHWSLSAEDAVALAKDMAPFNPWFLEAPVAPEDVEALQAMPQDTLLKIASAVEQPWGVGQAIGSVKPQVIDPILAFCLGGD